MAQRLKFRLPTKNIREEQFLILLLLSHKYFLPQTILQTFFYTKLAKHNFLAQHALHGPPSLECLCELIFKQLLPDKVF